MLQYFHTGINDTVAGDLTDVEIDNAGIQIANEIQLGNFSEVSNVSQSTSYSIASPAPNTDSQEWADTNTNSPYTVLYHVDSMRFNPAIVPLHEGTPFTTQPKVQILDASVSVLKRYCQPSIHYFSNYREKIMHHLLENIFFISPLLTDATYSDASFIRTRLFPVDIICPD